MEHHGPTEKAYRRWIQTMGPLTPEQASRAQGIFDLARGMDEAREAGTLAVLSSIHRELRMSSAQFRDVARLSTPTVVETPVTPIQSVQDELAARRNREARQ